MMLTMMLTMQVTMAMKIKTACVDHVKMVYHILPVNSRGYYKF